MTHLRRLCTAEARYVRRNEVQYVVCMYVCMYAIEEQETVYRWAGTRRMIYRDKQLSRREWPDSYCWWWSRWLMKLVGWK